MESNKLILEVSALGVRRSERWLFRGLDFTLSGAEMIQVVGENGAGKTSLLRCLCGLLSKAEGTINWAEQVQPIYLGHLAAVKPELSVFENLSLHPVASRFPSENKVLQAIIDVNLDGYEEELARRLSAGQVRRVALARLLLADSPCWILDEPFTSLDKAGCAWLEEKIADYVAAGGSLIVTSHQKIELPIQPKLIEIKRLPQSEYV